jgi:hypothetical protein
MLTRAAVFLARQSRAAAQSLHVLSSFRKSWRSKTFLAVWIAAAVWVWHFLARRDLNLPLSAAIGVASLQAILGSLESGGAKKLRRLLANRLGRLCFLVGCVTAFVYASLVAGDWGAVDLIPHAYFGAFHLHHWGWSLGQLVAVMAVLQCETPEACLEQAGRTLGLCMALVALAAACQLSPVAFPGNRSFQLVVVLNGLLLGGLSLLLRSRELADRWAGLFIAICLGVLVGVFANGAMGILRDFVIGQGIPGGLIFFEGSAPAASGQAPHP